MAKREKGVSEAEEAAAPEPRPKPQPIGTVRRTLERPDGTKVTVDVPIYAPFRLESGEAGPAASPPRRTRPGVKPKPTGSD